MAEISDDAIIRQIIWAVRDPGSIVPRNGHKESDDEWTARAVRCVLGGRLLPSGGEVREEWVARWTPNAEMAAKGYEVELSPPGSRQRAEQYARRLHEPDDGVVELLRQRTYIGPWEVLSDTSEVPDVD